MLKSPTGAFPRPDLLPERLAEHLREKIVSGAVAPGERLLEQVVAKECDVSRAPVREALRILESEGLVTLAPHRGARVTDVSEEEAGHLFPVRAALEALASRWAARRVARDGQAAIAGELEEIQRALAEMDTAAPQNDVPRYYRSGAAFHDALVSAADNPILSRQYAILQSTVRRYQAVMSRLPSSYLTSLGEHRAIVKAVLAGDEAEAARLSEAHVRRLESDFATRPGETAT